MYFTIEHNSGGYHGHQIKDSLGGRTIGELFGLKYLHTPYGYLDSFGLAGEHKVLKKWQKHLKFKTIRKVSGPLWNGISDYEETQDYFRDAFDFQDEKCLLVFENALRIHPFQTIPWHQKGFIQESIFESLAQEYTLSYSVNNQLNKSIGYSVAIHISRGVDFDKEKFPKHFKNSREVRYMFPLSYFENIIEQIKTVKPESRFNVYTEELHSDEVNKHFSSIEGVQVHVGSNRKEKNQALIKSIFHDFVSADVLVACNSSFSAMCSYFRYGKQTIYHPHQHLEYLPEPSYIATDPEGNFKTESLKLIN